MPGDAKPLLALPVDRVNRRGYLLTGSEGAPLAFNHPGFNWFLARGIIAIAMENGTSHLL